MKNVRKIILSWFGIFAILLMAGGGFFLVIDRVSAAQLSAISDTLSTQKQSTAANHFFVFTNPATISSGSITIDLSNAVSSTATVDYTDIDLSYGATGTETDASLAAAAGAGVWGANVNSLTKIITLSYPLSGGTAIATGNKVFIKIGTNASFQITGDSQLVNASSAGSAMITVNAGGNTGRLAVAVTDSSTVGLSGDISQTTPSAPTSLAASVISSAQINLSWTDNADNETGFELERRTVNSSYALVAALSADTVGYSDSGRAPSTQYFYRVRAINGSGSSTYSNEVTATTQAGGAAPFFPSPPPPPPEETPSRPANISGVNGSYSNGVITISWDAPTDPDISSVQIQRSTGGYPTSPTDGETVFQAPLNTYTDPNPVLGTTYFYTIYAVGRSGLYSTGTLFSLVIPGTTTPPTTTPPTPGEPPATPGPTPTTPPGQPTPLTPPTTTPPAPGEIPGQVPSGQQGSDAGTPSTPPGQGGGGIPAYCNQPYSFGLGAAQQVVATRTESHTVNVTHSDQSGMQMVFPANASPDDLTLRVEPYTINQTKEWIPDVHVSPSQLVIGEMTYRVTAQKGGQYVTQFQKPITMTFRYNARQVCFCRELTGKVYRWDDLSRKWLPESSSRIDPVKKTITITTNHFTFFALIADALPVDPEDIEEPTPEESTESSVETSDIAAGSIELSESGKGKLTIQKDSFQATAGSTLEICIPASLFKKPVKTVSVILGDDQYLLVLDPKKGCYYTKITVPKKKGQYEMLLRVTYMDDSVEIIRLGMSVLDLGFVPLDPLSQFSRVANQAASAAAVLNEAVGEAVEAAQPALQAAVVATAPILAASNPGILSNLANLQQYISQLISWILSLFGIKRRRRSWGSVYNAITKTPVDLAIVRLFDAKTKRLIATEVTDGEGRFSFIPRQGEYYIEAAKPPLHFPSGLIAGAVDGEYSDVYRGGVFAITDDEQLLKFSIPLDPVDVRVKARSPLKRLGVVLEKYSVAMMAVSLVMSILLAVYIPSLLNIAILGVFSAFFVMQIVLLPKKEKTWGTVFDALTLEPVPLTAISIFNAKTNKLLKTRLSDYLGRFNFLAPPGEYKVTVQRANYVFPPRKTPKTKKFKNVYMGDTFTLKRDKGIIKADIPMERKSIT